LHAQLGAELAHAQAFDTVAVDQAQGGLEHPGTAQGAAGGLAHPAMLAPPSVGFAGVCEAHRRRRPTRPALPRAPLRRSRPWRGGPPMKTKGLASQAMVDRERAERAVRELLLAVGEDPDREGLTQTPRRVAEMYREILCGIEENPRDHLEVVFDEGHDEIVVARGIPVYSVCEHHLMPFHGVAHVAYLPNEKGQVCGLSKIHRTVQAYARRLQVQERMTTQIADVIEEALDPRGVFVVVEAEHLCVSMRGVRMPG